MKKETKLEDYIKAMNGKDGKMIQPERIPRRAKKGRMYVKMPYYSRTMWGKIYTNSAYLIHAMLHNSRFRRNTKGSRQFVNIMVRHGLMKRPKPLFRRRVEMVLDGEQIGRLKERILLNPPAGYTERLRFKDGHIIERIREK